MFIKNDGNVGIGTTSPGRGLTIDKSNANAALEIIKKNTTNQIVYLGTGSSGGTDDPLLRMFHNTTENIRLYTTGDSWINGGNVGIGTTSPQQPLHVQSAGDLFTRYQANSNANGVQFQTWHGNSQTMTINSNTTNPFAVYVGSASGTIAINVDSNANVGIGTTTPNYI